MRTIKLVALLLFAIALGCLASIDSVLAAPSPPIPTTDVNVVNTPSNPVPTVDVGDGKQPFAASRDVGTNPGGEVLVSVPAGKRLVIETVTFFGSIATTGGGITPVMDMRTNGVLMAHKIAAIPTGSTATTQYYLGTHAVRLYVDPGSGVVVRCFAQLAGNQFCSFTISGYFVDVP
jgi:hypothetical protein